MEIKVNREIRDYSESVILGLSMRQFLFSLCACGIAVFLYFTTNKILNKELVSWICILGTLPFVGLGFFKYNGMPLEEFAVAFVKSEILTPKNLKFISENIYYEAVLPLLKKEESSNDKIDNQN